jgi:RecA-family ATPase
MALRTDDPFLTSPPLPHEQLRLAVTARRLAYVRLGYEPIPILSGRKRPAMNGWQDVRITIPPDDEDVITPWADTYPGALSTGIRTRYTPGFDIDIRDQDVADQVERALLNMIPQQGTVLKRVGLPPKRLIPFRCVTPFKKISATFKAPDDVVHKVEVLADGQQFVAEGIHETTQQPYRWADNVSLLNVAHEQLPLVDEALARRLVAEAGEIMRRAGWVEVGAKTNGKTNGKGNRNTANEAAKTETRGSSIYGRTALRAECDKLAAMPKDSGRNNALNGAAFNLFQLVAGGELDEERDQVRERLFAAAEACGLVAEDGAASVRATIESGAKAGRAQPRQASGPNGGDRHDDQAGDQTVERPPLPWIDMSNWDREPVPERKWAIRNRVPLNQVGLLSGEGGAGKSLIELAKNVAHVAGKDWLGSMPEVRPAIYVGAEDDKDELHIRLAAIAKHYGVTFDELIAGGLHVLCLLGQDATLCAATGKSGRVEATDLYRQVYEAAGDIKPINISIDTLSRAFAGNEIDRVQVYAFAMHMQALALVAGGSVTVLSHPSLQGIASGTGLSGSTAWQGAFRFRQYLKGIKPDSGEQPDHDLRELEFKKNQYGPISDAITLRYQNGLFLPVPGTSFAQAARDAKADDVFLDLLARFTNQNRYVSDKTSANYAPALFAKEDAAKAAGLTSHHLAGAMRRLFASGRIWNDPCGKPSRPQYRIAIKL